MVRPEWPYAAAREQLLSDESGGRSRAGEVAGEARPGQGASPPANAERLSADAGWGRGADLRRNLISPGDVSFAGPAPDAAKEIMMRLGFVLTIAAEAIQEYARVRARESKVSRETVSQLRVRLTDSTMSR
jgi:hypothetical protein